MPPAAAGTIIGEKYRLEDVIGTGAMGTVWRAVQLGLDRPVAVKLMHPQYAVREESRARFAREARVAATLDHPCSVAVLDFGEDEGVLYLVMELLEGRSLRERLEAPVGLAETITIVRQIASALAAAHRIRLVHRDIKPENVFLETVDGAIRAKVVDFGLAFIADPDTASSSAVGRLTEDGRVAGTPAYMAPEQVRGAAIGPPCDIYALGCVFYELVAGRPPFSGSVGDVFTRHAYAPVIPLRQLELPAPLPAALDELILAMLAKSPATRPSANRLIAALAAHERLETGDRLGRTPIDLGTREHRAVPRGALSEDADEAGVLEVDVSGDIPLELDLALAAAGIGLGRAGNAGVVYVRSAELATVERLVAAGKVVVVELDAADAAKLPALIRAGAADAVVAPVRAEELVPRLRRAAASPPRRSGS